MRSLLLLSMLTLLLFLTGCSEQIIIEEPMGQYTFSQSNYWNVTKEGKVIFQRSADYNPMGRVTISDFPNYDILTKMYDATADLYKMNAKEAFVDDINANKVLIIKLNTELLIMWKSDLRTVSVYFSDTVPSLIPYKNNALVLAYLEKYPSTLS